MASGSDKDAPKEGNFRIPGLRGAKTTTLFRAVNPELFIRPVRPTDELLGYNCIRYIGVCYQCRLLFTCYYICGLFILQNKPVMAFGLVTITLCVGYLGYLHATKDNDQQLYEAIDSEGEKNMRRKTSKWD